MSRVGRLLLWTRAPSTLRKFAAVTRSPVESRDSPAPGDPAGQRRQRVRAPARVRRHHIVPAVPGAGANRAVRGPRAVHHKRNEWRTQAAHHASAGAVHHHERDDRGVQVHTDDPRGQRGQVPTHLAVAVRPVPGPPGDRRRADPQRGQPGDRGACAQRGADRSRVRARLPELCRRPFGRCTPRRTRSSPSTTTRPSTTRCCGWPPGRTSASSRRSTPARSCCWPTGWAGTPSRSSGMSGTAAVARVRRAREDPRLAAAAAGRGPRHPP